MIQMFRQMRLRSQVLLIAVIILIMNAITMVTFIRMTNDISRQANRDVLNSSVSQLARVVEKHYLDLENYVDTLAYSNSVSNFVESETPGRRWINGRELQTMVSSFEAVNTNIARMLYMNDDTLLISTGKSGDYLLALEIARQLGLDDQKYLPGDVAYSRIAYPNSGALHYLILSSSYYDYFYDKPLFMVLELNMDPIQEIVHDFSSDGVLYLLLDECSNLIASNGEAPSWSGQTVAQIVGRLAAGIGAENLFDDLSDDLCYEVPVSRTGWRVIGISNLANKTQDIQRSISWVVVVTTIMTVLLALFVLLINGSILSPILEIARFAHSVGNDYTTARLQVRQSNEIGTLSLEINRMLDNIRSLNEKIRQSEQKLHMTEMSKQQVRFAALQSQINPHFLYNTLDCMRGIALKEGVRSIADMANSVSKIFRYSIKAGDYVRVRDELDCIRNYMVIIDVRHGERIRIFIEADEALLDLYIPKMILQPIVENAVFHGLEPLKNGGCIYISASQNGRMTVFCVRDDGMGMEPGQLSLLRNSFNESAVQKIHLNEKKSIGILNIYQRLALIYGQRFSMDVESSPHSGTEVRILLSGLTADLAATGTPSRD